MDIQFYNVKKKSKVSVPENMVKKVKYEKTTKEGKQRITYALKAVDDGTKLTKFVSEDDWKKLNAPEE